MTRGSKRAAGRRRSMTCTAVVLVVACALGPAPSPAEAAPAARDDFEIRTVSTRPDTVSGGDVLVEVRVPGHVPRDQVSVRPNGRDVTAAFAPAQGHGSLLGLVQGLELGRNRLEAGAPARVARGRPTATLTVVNHPITGPVIAGPHQTPFVCETEAWGFGPPLDADCSVETRVEYFYRSGATNTFQPLRTRLPRRVPSGPQHRDEPAGEPARRSTSSGRPVRT